MANKIMNVIFFKNENDKNVAIKYLEKDDIVRISKVSKKWFSYVSDWGYPCNTLEELAKNNPKMYFKNSFATEFRNGDYYGNIFNDNGYLDDREIARSYEVKFQNRIWDYENTHK